MPGDLSCLDLEPAGDPDPLQGLRSTVGQVNPNDGADRHEVAVPTDHEARDRLRVLSRELVPDEAFDLVEMDITWQ